MRGKYCGNLGFSCILVSLYRKKGLNELSLLTLGLIHSYTEIASMDEKKKTAELQNRSYEVEVCS